MSATTGRWAALALLLASATAAGAPVTMQDAPALLQTYKCTICHSDDTAKAGPAFRDIAAAYRKDPRARSKVTAVIRKGRHGGGPWHMPPHPEVSRAEAEVMARYILALDR